MTANPAWEYRTSSWVEGDEPEDRRKTNKHMKEWAEAGWELLSANAVWRHNTQSVVRGDRVVGQIVTIGFTIHHFYWRRPAQP